MDDQFHETEPTHQPAEGFELEPLVYGLGISLLPSIRLDSKTGMEFANELARYFEARQVTFESTQWLYQSLKGEFVISVKNSGFELVAERPSQGKEWFETRYSTVLDCWGRQFSPKLVAESKALIRGLIPIDGDAREFLARNVMNMSPSRLAPMRRPLHILGVRMFFPPLLSMEGTDSETKTSTIPWQVDVKLESWFEDPSKLFVEAEATWPTPHPWDVEICNQDSGRLAELSDYIGRNIIPFVRQGTEESDGNSC